MLLRGDFDELSVRQGECSESGIIVDPVTVVPGSDHRRRLQVMRRYKWRAGDEETKLWGYSDESRPVVRRGMDPSIPFGDDEDLPDHGSGGPCCSR